MAHIMEIRGYRPEDLDELRRLTMAAFAGVSIDENIERRFGLIHGHDWRWRKGKHIDEDAAAHPDGIFVAEEAGRILGFVTTRVDRAEGTGHIPNLVVAAEARGRGLGRLLIDHALDTFRAQGLTHAKIETLEQNAVGRHLFPACGFEEVARKIYFYRQL